MKYEKKLRQSIIHSGSCLCVGLDPHLHLFPDFLEDEIPDDNERVYQFLSSIIEITSPYCAAFKPNLAFFEALGDDGFPVLHKLIEQIPDDKIIIADAKRGDIDSTARHYRKAFFEHYDVDAITLNPLMGFETLAPFFNFPGKALYVLTLTSNPGAEDFLNKPFSGFNSMAEYIAAKLHEYQPQSQAQLGMVVGATHPHELEHILLQHTSGPLLIPGIGSQGGKIEELVSLLEKHDGLPLISSSRSILFAGGDSRDWKKKVEKQVTSYRKDLSVITKRYV